MDSDVSHDTVSCTCLQHNTVCSVFCATPSSQPVDIECTEDQLSKSAMFIQGAPLDLPAHGAAVGDLDEGHEGLSEPSEDASHVEDLNWIITFSK